MPLTNTACKNATPTDKPYRLADGGGMYLEVMPNGSKYWRLKYRFADKEKRLALGVYPQISLAEARERREAAKKQRSNGIDPSFAKQEQKRQSALSAENTFEAVAREWHEHQKARWSPNHATDILHRLEKDIFPVLGRRPIADLAALHVLDLLRKIEKRGAHEMARRAVQYCGQIFRYAVVTGRTARDPTADLRGALQPVQHGHYAAIESDELPEFLRTLENNDARLFIQTRLAVRLLMLTFVRTGEMIGAKWDEIDLTGRQWVIASEYKTKVWDIILSQQRKKIAWLIEGYKFHGQPVPPRQQAMMDALGTEISHEERVSQWIQSGKNIEILRNETQNPTLFRFIQAMFGLTKKV